MRKTHKCTAPKMNDSRGGRLFIDLSGEMPTRSIGGRKYAIIWVDDISRFKMTGFLKNKSDTAKARKTIIAKCFDLNIRIASIWKDEGWENQGGLRHLTTSVSDTNLNVKTRKRTTAWLSMLLECSDMEHQPWFRKWERE